MYYTALIFLWQILFFESSPDQILLIFIYRVYFNFIVCVYFILLCAFYCVYFILSCALKFHFIVCILLRVFLFYFYLFFFRANFLLHFTSRPFSRHSNYFLLFCS